MSAKHKQRLDVLCQKHTHTCCKRNNIIKHANRTNFLLRCLHATRSQHMIHRRHHNVKRSLVCAASGATAAAFCCQLVEPNQWQFSAMHVHDYTSHIALLEDKIITVSCDIWKHALTAQWRSSVIEIRYCCRKTYVTVTSNRHHIL